MDESRNPTLHRWLSFCRLLMLFHPRVGAEMYAIKLGRSQYRPGWNAIHRSLSRLPGEPDVKYMWVSEFGGRLTSHKPECPDKEVHHVYEDDTPHLHQTSAWLRMHELAELLIERNHPEFPSEKVSSIMERIERTSNEVPLRNDNGTIEELYTNAKHYMQKG